MNNSNSNNDNTNSSLSRESDYNGKTNPMALEKADDVVHTADEATPDNFEGGFQVVVPDEEEKSYTKQDDTEVVHLSNNTIAFLSRKIYSECYLDFDNAKNYLFTAIIKNGLYFPQIVQFIAVIIAIFSGHTSFKDILIYNLWWGIGATLAWFVFKLYKFFPGINTICFILGTTIFKYFIHLIIIALVSIFVLGNWKIFLYCLIGGLITRIISIIIFSFLNNKKYCDKVAIYISNFKT